MAVVPWHVKDECRTILKNSRQGFRTHAQIRKLINYTEQAQIFPENLDDQEVLVDLCQHLRLIPLPKNSLLFLQGQAASTYYIIFSGAIEIIQTKDPVHLSALKRKYSHNLLKGLGDHFSLNKLGNKLCSLPDNRGFGELALLKEGGTRATHAFAQRPTEVLALEKRVYVRTLRPFHLDQANIGDTFHFLRRLVLFKGVPNKLLTEVSYALKIVSFPSKTTVFSRGDKVKHIYILFKGSLSIFDERNGIPLQLSSQSKGTVIGAHEILSGKDELEHTFKAKTGLEMYRMSLHHFRQIRRSSSGVQDFKNEQETWKHQHRLHAKNMQRAHKNMFSSRTAAPKQGLVALLTHDLQKLEGSQSMLALAVDEQRELPCRTLKPSCHKDVQLEVVEEQGAPAKCPEKSRFTFEFCPRTMEMEPKINNGPQPPASANDSSVQGRHRTTGTTTITIVPPPALRCAAGDRRPLGHPAPGPGPPNGGGGGGGGAISSVTAHRTHLARPRAASHAALLEGGGGGGLGPALLVGPPAPAEPREGRGGKEVPGSWSSYGRALPRPLSAQRQPAAAAASAGAATGGCRPPGERRGRAWYDRKGAVSPRGGFRGRRPGPGGGGAALPSAVGKGGKVSRPSSAKSQPSSRRSSMTFVLPFSSPVSRQTSRRNSQSSYEYPTTRPISAQVIRDDRHLTMTNPQTNARPASAHVSRRTSHTLAAEDSAVPTPHGVLRTHQDLSLVETNPRHQQVSLQKHQVSSLHREDKEESCHDDSEASGLVCSEAAVLLSSCGDDCCNSKCLIPWQRGFTNLQGKNFRSSQQQQVHPQAGQDSSKLSAASNRRTTAMKTQETSRGHHSRSKLVIPVENDTMVLPKKGAARPKSAGIYRGDLGNSLDGSIRRAATSTPLQSRRGASSHSQRGSLNMFRSRGSSMNISQSRTNSVATSSGGHERDYFDIVSRPRLFSAPNVDGGNQGKQFPVSPRAGQNVGIKQQQFSGREYLLEQGVHGKGVVAGTPVSNAASAIETRDAPGQLTQNEDSPGAEQKHDEREPALQHYARLEQPFPEGLARDGSCLQLKEKTVISGCANNQESLRQDHSKSSVLNTGRDISVASWASSSVMVERKNL